MKLLFGNYLDYESLTNLELLGAARAKGMKVTATWNNRLTTVRGVEDDRIGSRDRREFIGMLRARDQQSSTTFSNVVSLIALLIATASLFASILLD
jgi:hypothetical protein